MRHTPRFASIIRESRGCLCLRGRSAYHAVVDGRDRWGGAQPWRTAARASSRGKRRPFEGESAIEAFDFAVRVFDATTRRSAQPGSGQARPADAWTDPTFRP